MGKAGRARRMDGCTRRAAHNLRGKPEILSPRRREMGRNQKSTRRKTQRLIPKGSRQSGSPASQAQNKIAQHTNLFKKALAIFATIVYNS